MGFETNNGEINPGINGYSRISVITTVSGKLIHIRYQPAAMQKASLTLLIAVSILIQAFSVFAMISLPLSYMITLPLFATGVLTMLVSFRYWLWAFFGEECVEINENRIIVNRSSLLTKTQSRIVELDEQTNLYINMSDNWSWKTLREKGVFRVGNESQKIDVGIKLNEKDFETLLLLLNKSIRTYKEMARNMAHTTKEVYTETAPSLDKQLDGKLEQTVDGYFNQNSANENLVNASNGYKTQPTENKEIGE